jgi:hypothetical protein
MSRTHSPLNTPTIPDFWSLSDRQLERACRIVAEGRVPSSLPFLRAEAMRLFLLWREGNVEVAQERREGERAARVPAYRIAQTHHSNPGADQPYGRGNFRS